jgi:vitellogenic carboxypeptidase-like protein
MLMKEPANFDYYVGFLDRPEVRKAIHVGNLNYSSISTKVEASMSSDMGKSVKAWIEDLLNNNYKVGIRE